jgi:hypothetical protein
VAELSIHLVGEKPGFAPHDERLDHIVKLQLALARERAASVAEDLCKFRRTIWVPKLLESAGQADGPVTERDPLGVLARFDRQIASDTVIGDILGKFVESLLRDLAEATSRRVVRPSIGTGFSLYLSFNDADEDLGFRIAEALQGGGSVKIVIPVSEKDADARQYNRNLLAKCNSVTVCWGNAPEAWVRSEAQRIENWQSLGRSEQFAFRALVKGPPESPRKKPSAMKFLFQPSAFDAVLDVGGDSPIEDLLAGFRPALSRPEAQ